MRHNRIGSSLAAVILLVGMAALATTWSDVEQTCPLCGKSVEVKVIASYGSYIYGWPSRFQLVFWPATTNMALYFCDRCHLSVFMGDFEKLPTSRHQAVKKAIAPLKKAPGSGKYHEVSMAYRLKLAEAIYRQLDKNDEFWCRFYRIQGYHLEALGKPAGAKAARLKALGLAEKMLESEKPAMMPKELTLIVGSMQHFTGQTEKAQATLDRVPGASARMEGMSEEQVDNATKFLDGVANDLLALIKAGKKVPD